MKALAQTLFLRPPAPTRCAGCAEVTGGAAWCPDCHSDRAEAYGEIQNELRHARQDLEAAERRGDRARVREIRQEVAELEKELATYRD